jgi:type I restriction enzyme, S subunit
LNCSEWKKVKLGEVADVLSGYAFKSKDFVEQGVPVVKIKNITPPVVDISEVEYVTEEMYEDKKRYSLSYNDILISLTGSHINQMNSAVGKIGRVRIKDKKLLLNQRVGKIYVTDTEKCDCDFLFYYLSQEEIRYKLASSAGGSANQANISPVSIKNLDIFLPPLSEQREIAAILLSLDEKIELNNEMNKTLEEMAQAIFKRWFVDFEFPNENGEPYKSSGGKFVESEFGMMPEGWKEGTLDNLVVINTASVDPKENPETLYEHYSIPAFDEQKYPKFEYGREIKSNKYLVSPNSFLVSKLNPTTKRVWDPLCITENAISSTEFINYLPKDISYQSYLYCVLNSERFSEHLIKHATGSTGSRQRVKPADTLTFNVILPDTETLKKFDNLIKPIREKLKINQINSAVLKDVRDTLLPKLMSGEIRVSDAEREVEECLQKSN